MSSIDLNQRVVELERRMANARRAMLVGGLLAIVVALSGWVTSPISDIIRTRGIIIVDEAGRERIYIGSPLPDPIEGKRIQPGTGLTIVDTLGVERFGLGLFPNGRVVMGFDAPRGTGDERNRERLSLVADEHGGAYLRLLDRKTRARAFLSLEESDEAALHLLDWTADSIRIRRIGFGGDSVTSEPR